MARQLDSLDFSLASYADGERALAFDAPGRTEAELWQRELRGRLVDLLGGFPAKPCPLSPTVTETVELRGYTREAVHFQSRPDSTVFGYLLTPKPLRAPAPAVLCLHGHGRGVDDIVGIREDGKMRSRLGGYQKDFALQCVRRGYVVLAIEQLGFGHRRDATARDARPGSSSCMPSAGAALLLGQTMIGWRVWDAIRSIDYLATRPEIESERLAVMGISGGGATSFFTAALEQPVEGRGRQRLLQHLSRQHTQHPALHRQLHPGNPSLRRDVRPGGAHRAALAVRRDRHGRPDISRRGDPRRRRQSARDLPRNGRGGPSRIRGVRGDAPVPRRRRVPSTSRGRSRPRRAGPYDWRYAA